MASSHPPTTFGASIVPSRDPTGPQFPLAMPDSPALTPATTRDEALRDPYMGKDIPPHSPFYQHPPASHELVATGTSKKGFLDVCEKDIESGNDAPLTPLSDDGHPFSQRIGVEGTKECTMWPSKQTLKQKHQTQKTKRREAKGLWGCAPLRARWGALSRRNRWIARIAIAFFIVGIAVAIGVGISVSVKGGYYTKDGTQNIGH